MIVGGGDVCELSIAQTKGTSLTASSTKVPAPRTRSVEEVIWCEKTRLKCGDCVGWVMYSHLVKRQAGQSNDNLKVSLEYRRKQLSLTGKEGEVDDQSGVQFPRTSWRMGCGSVVIEDGKGSSSCSPQLINVCLSGGAPSCLELRRAGLVQSGPKEGMRAWVMSFKWVVQLWR